VRLWRIAAETRSYPATDLTGAGAAQSPGRWNDHHEPVVYCAPTIALAVLETAAHVDDAGLPLNRLLVAIDVPDHVWDRREAMEATTLPTTWAAMPAARGSVKIGSNWLTSRRSAILTVPSVIVPEEAVCLVNPRHSDTAAIRATISRRFAYNRLFRR